MVLFDKVNTCQYHWHGVTIPFNTPLAQTYTEVLSLYSREIMKRVLAYLFERTRAPVDLNLFIDYVYKFSPRPFENDGDHVAKARQDITRLFVESIAPPHLQAQMLSNLDDLYDEAVDESVISLYGKINFDLSCWSNFVDVCSFLT